MEVADMGMADAEDGGDEILGDEEGGAAEASPRGRRQGVSSHAGGATPETPRGGQREADVAEGELNAASATAALSEDELLRRVAELLEDQPIADEKAALG